MNFIKAGKNGHELWLRVTPNAKIEKIDGIETRDDGKSYLKVKTRAIPEDGAANAAIIKIIAKALKIPKSDIEILSGHNSRQKCLLIKNEMSQVEILALAHTDTPQK